MYCKCNLDSVSEYGETLALAIGEPADLKCPKCNSVWRYWVNIQLNHKLIKGGKFSKHK